MNLVQLTKEWFAQLQSRERRTILVGLVLVVLAVVYVIIEPRWKTHWQLDADVKTRQGDLLWLSQQVSKVQALRNSCPSRASRGSKDSDMIPLLVRRNQLKMREYKNERGLSTLNVTADDANSILRLIGQIACEEFLLRQLKLEKLEPAEKGAKFNATMEFTRVQ